MNLLNPVEKQAVGQLLDFLRTTFARDAAVFHDGLLRLEVRGAQGLEDRIQQAYTEKATEVMLQTGILVILTFVA